MENLILIFTISDDDTNNYLMKFYGCYIEPDDWQILTIGPKNPNLLLLSNEFIKEPDIILINDQCDLDDNIKKLMEDYICRSKSIYAIYHTGNGNNNKTLIEKIVPSQKRHTKTDHHNEDGIIYFDLLELSMVFNSNISEYRRIIIKIINN